MSTLLHHFETQAELKTCSTKEQKIEEICKKTNQIFKEYCDDILFSLIYKLITENEMLRRKNEEISQKNDPSLATLAHELKTPMTAILCWIEALNRCPMDMTKIKYITKEIEKSAHIQNNLIKNLLNTKMVN